MMKGGCEVNGSFSEWRRGLRGLVNERPERAFCSRWQNLVRMEGNVAGGCWEDGKMN